MRLLFIWALLGSALLARCAARSIADAHPAETRQRGSPLQLRLSEPQRYFGGIGIAGATACSITHSLVVPLDVIKTRLQTDSTVRGPVAAATAVLRASPHAGLMRCSAFFNGIAPTAVGYWLQGACKFGGYEIFKQRAFSGLRKSGGEDAVRTWCLPVMLASAATAEFCAPALLAPLEVLKLRVQTDPASASRGVLRTVTHIVRHEGFGALYAGFCPIALRQLPYTMTKLVAYELVARVSPAMHCSRAPHSEATLAAVRVASPPLAHLLPLHTSSLLASHTPSCST